MMNKLFSLHSIGGGRFFLLILLLINLQIVQAACKHSDVPLSDASPLFIADGTVISGVEKVYIHHLTKEKVKRKVKKKNSPLSNKRKYKKEQKLSQTVENSNTNVSIFIGNTTSDKSLLAASDTDKQIIRPTQHMIKFILFGSNYKAFAVGYLLDIFLKRPHTDQWFSNPCLLRNFNRPPPFIQKTTV
ncbi:hypothetical protein [Chryseobacterium sp.]|uniref:hypothetical protein n=1 Tax=Chryseobacterium sp. TaxID=1871047 RepID=UPI0024E20F2B|nr:hypothetical protein [Chryseobacterium sp.]